MEDSRSLQVILDDIFRYKYKQRKYIQKDSQLLLPNIMVVATKPFGTFYEPFIMEVLERVMHHKYQVCEYCVMNSSDIVDRNIIKKQYKYLYDISIRGKELFTHADYQNINNIYGENEYPLIPANELKTRYGYTDKMIANLWRKGYQKDEENGKIGIQKIGLYKYVLLVKEEKVNEGKPFLLINGLAIELEEIYQQSNEKICVFLIASKSKESSSWKEMREKCIGDKAFPLHCSHESIRYQSYKGIIQLKKKVNYWNNVIHMSSSLLETLHDEMIWMNRDLSDSYVGNILLQQGFTEDMILQYLKDPIFENDGKMNTLYHCIDKIDSEKAINILKNIKL